MSFARLADMLRHTDSGPISGLPYAEMLGLRFEHRDGGLVLLMPAAAGLVGSPMPPRLHGGVVAGLLEMSAICTLIEAFPAGEAVPRLKPVNVTVDYLRAGAVAESYARATVMRLGRRVANVRAEAWQDDTAKPIATAHMNVMFDRS